jgi:hypothetical protein
VNREIDRFLQTIEEHRHRLIMLERVGAESSGLADFLGLPAIDGDLKRANTALEWADYYQQQGLSRQLERSGWSDEERDAFDIHCGDVMDSFYPDWRQES